MSNVVVLGAGPAGLWAALEAAEAGHHVVVLEAADHVGGMSASFEIAGQRVDYGSHRLHPATDPIVLARIRDLLGDDLQARPRNGRIRLRDRWVGFPLRAVDMARSLPLDFGARAAFDALTRSLRHDAATQQASFADEIERRLGPTVFSEFYEPYALKLYGTAAQRLDRELADRRVAATSPVQILRKVARAARPEGRTFWYPRRGYGQIVDELHHAAIDAGVDVRVASPATYVTTSNEHGCTIGVGETPIHADVILSSIAKRTLASIMRPAPAPAVLAALGSLRTRAMVLVYVVVAQDQYTPYDAHYFPEGAVTMCRLSEPKNYRDGDDPPDQTVLCAEFACWEGDDTWTATDAELADRVTADLARAGLPTVAVQHVETRRLPHVYPIFEPATATARRAGHEWVQRLDRVLSFGRQGLGVPDNLHHVLMMATAAVESVRYDGTIDRARWSASLVDFASHVVED